MGMKEILTDLKQISDIKFFFLTSNNNDDGGDNDDGDDEHSDLVLQKQFHHLKVLIVNAHEQGGPDDDDVNSQQSTVSPSEGVDAVNVDGVSLLLQHSPEREIVIPYKSSHPNHY